MNQTKIFLILSFCAAILFNLGELNYYPQLSQGDHGRDLYAVQEILRGKTPYKDFWWVYGPAMPYYYAIFYKLGGENIASILFGKLLLKALCAAFFFLAASRFMPALLAFIAAMFFTQTQPDFFFTFNHIGGIAMELGILYLLFAYIKNQNTRVLFFTLPLVFLYCLVKINFGLTALLAIAITVAITDFIYKRPFDKNKKVFYAYLMGLLPAVVAVIYGFLFQGLSSYNLHQCMPYFGDDQPHHFPPSMTIPYYFTQHWLTLTHAFGSLANLNKLPPGTPWFVVLMNYGNVIFSLYEHFFIHAATLAVGVMLLFKRIDKDQLTKLLLAVLCLGLFFVLNFHEFVVSGVWYRTYWSLPFLFMFHFLVMNTALRPLPPWARGILWTPIALLVALGFTINFFVTKEQKVPPRFIQSTHGQIYAGNEPQWTDTVNSVTAFLSQNLKPGETFFALPYDCIYYFLTGRPSPTRQLIFFDHIHIPQSQEISIIQDLESKNVAYVLLSNRMASSETGLGIFGKTYCPLLAQYIMAKYAPVARQGGDWQSEPGWGHNHGMMIFRKR